MIPIILATIENPADRNKCAELYEKYKGLMMHIALGKTEDYALAEDIVSESAIKMMRHLNKIYLLEGLQRQQYIANIVRSTCIDHFRKANKQVVDSVETLGAHSMVSNDSGANPLENLVNNDGYEAIVAMIMALPDTLKDVAYLSLVLEYDHNEIAELLDISYDNSKQRLLRAKAAIKKKLSKQMCKS